MRRLTAWLLRGFRRRRAVGGRPTRATSTSRDALTPEEVCARLNVLDGPAREELAALVATQRQMEATVCERPDLAFLLDPLVDATRERALAEARALIARDGR